MGTWLSGTLYYVHDGEIQELNALSVGRTPNAIGAPHWVDMRITLALVTYESEHGSITQLCKAGQSRAGGNGSELPTTVVPTHTQFVAGRMFGGQSRILYIEGDTTFELSSGMDVEAFAEANNGTFYVVVVGLG